MVEIIGSMILMSYSVIAFWYSIRMENDKILKQVYATRTDKDWSEICFAVGFAWPLGFLINYIVRRLR